MEMSPPAVVTSLALPRVMSSVSVIVRGPMPVIVASREVTAVVTLAPSDLSESDCAVTSAGPVMVLPEPLAVNETSLFPPPAVTACEMTIDPATVVTAMTPPPIPALPTPIVTSLESV